MKKFLAFLLLWLLVPLPVAALDYYPPLQVKWSWPNIVAGDIYSFDLERDGREEIYVCTYPNQEEKGHIYVLNSSAHLLLDTWVEGHIGESDFKRPEYIKFLWIGDVDYDTNLDILAASEIKGGQVNTNILYLFERELEPGLQVKNQRRWHQEDTGFVTRASYEDLDRDGQRELLVASLNANLYSFNPAGNLKSQLELLGSVWDFSSGQVLPGPETELVLTSHSLLILFQNSQELWNFSAPEGFRGVELIPQGNSSLIAAITPSSLYLLDSGGQIIKQRDYLNIKDLVLWDVDQDLEKEILILAESTVSVLEADNNLSSLWEFTLPEFPRALHVHHDQLLILAKKLMSFTLNEDYHLNEVGLGYLEAAKNSYEEQDCETTLEKALLAREIFQRINHTGALLEADHLVIQCSPSEEEVLALQKANQYLSFGRDHYHSGDLERAQIYLDEALALYLEWGYRDQAIQADSLLREINEQLRLSREKEAVEHYQRALEFLQNEHFPNATHQAETALQAYLMIQDETGVSRVQSLLEDIKTKEAEHLSEHYFSQAQRSWAVKDFSQLAQDAERAQSYYLQREQTLKVKEKVSRCEEFLLSVKKYHRAELYYRQALQSFEAQDYAASEQYLKAARELFLELEDVTAIGNCEDLSLRIKEETGEWWEEYLLFLSLALLAILVLLVLIIWKKFH